MCDKKRTRASRREIPVFKGICHLANCGWRHGSVQGNRREERYEPDSGSQWLYCDWELPWKKTRSSKLSKKGASWKVQWSAKKERYTEFELAQSLRILEPLFSQECVKLGSLNVPEPRRKSIFHVDGRYMHAKAICLCGIRDLLRVTRRCVKHSSRISLSPLMKPSQSRISWAFIHLCLKRFEITREGRDRPSQEHKSNTHSSAAEGAAQRHLAQPSITPRS